MAVSLTVNASLKALNTFGIDVRAARLIELDTIDQLPDALRLAHELQPLLVLGGGSNMLFTQDFPGTVLQLKASSMQVLGDSPDGTVLVECEAGQIWDDFVQWTLAQGLFGLENLSLIPGSVGASPVQNIGAYGVEMCELFESLRAVGLSSGQIRTFSKNDCAFTYRDSFFKSQEPGRWLITSVCFRLSRTPTLRTDYADLREQLARDRCVNPSPVDIARAVSSIRRRKLPDPTQLGNAGSFFKNPVIPLAQAQALREREPGIACWPDRDGMKISAAWMIDHCGFKGYRDGDAGVHESHALVLVNHGKASGAELIALARKIQHAVYARFGVPLEPEPLIL